MRVGSPLRRIGLTLFELVVVLAILAAVTATASVATDRILLRRRAEVTTETLDAFRESLLGTFGSARQVGRVSASRPTAVEGFIADLGRLPLATGSDPGTQLAELWDNPNGVAAYSLKTAAGDPDVSLSCGWRGPYLDLPVGGSVLTDGFGRAMSVLSMDAGGGMKLAESGDPIMGLTSLGSDGVLGAGSSDLPLSEDTTLWLGGSLSTWQSDITVRVYERLVGGGRTSPSQAGSLMVRLYLPDGATGDIAFQQSVLVNTPGTATFGFPATLIGRKVLRAYWVSGDASESRQSEVLPIEVHRAGQTEFELLLPPLPVPSTP